MPYRRTKMHRVISWALAVFSLATVTTGYSLARGWLSEIYTISAIHRVFEIGFIVTMVLHIGITLKYYGLNYRKMVKMLKERRGTKIHGLRLVQRISSWLIVIFALLIIIPGLNGYPIFAQVLENVIPFKLHTVFDFLLVSVIIIHIGVGLKFAAIRKRMTGIKVDVPIAALVISLLLVTVMLEVTQTPIPLSGGQNPFPPHGVIPVDSFGNVTGYITVGAYQYSFNSDNVETTRPDIFRPGAFSMFDVLVHVASKSSIDLVYYFNESMNTHVIDSINGTENWWYMAWYSGGWPERNVYRMDHYHWKNGTTLEMYQESEEYLESIYASYIEEADRLQHNNGSITIPEVNIYGNTFRKEFFNVSITAHGLRNDIFQPSVITAIDIIMSLGDAGEITYQLTWYDEIGRAGVVRNYFVTAIDMDVAVGTCGFVYEAGDADLGRNHIHLPSDSRVLNAPEYSLWFWICL